MNKFAVDSTIDLDGLARKIRDQQLACKAFFATRQARIDDVEDRLIAEIDRLHAQLNDWGGYEADLGKFRESLRNEREELDLAAVEMESRASQLDQQRLELDAQRDQIEHELEDERVRLRSASQEDQAQWQQSLEAAKAELANESSLRMIAESQRDALDGRLADQLARFARLEAETREVKEELLSARHEEHQLRSQLAESRKLLDQRAKQLKALRDTVERERGASGENAAELNLLQQDREQLQTRVHELEAELAKAASPSGELEELNDLRRRFEMAVEDVRKLRQANEQLERKLQEVSSTAAPADDGTWEQRKQQLLHRLSQMEESGSDASQLERLNNAVRMTDEVVAEKDRQIADLVCKIQSLQDALGEAAREEVRRTSRSGDEHLAAEQERLCKLQEEWREKFRAAEIEIAVQRAENARHRAELDERARDIEAQLALAKKQVAISASQKGDEANKARKRWFK